MIWFGNDEETKLKDKKEYFNIMKEIEHKERPSFKDLLVIMLAQYAIILPMVIIGLILFAFILYIFMAWIK